MRLSVCCTAFLIFSLTLLASSRTSGQSIKDTRIELQVQHESLKAALQKLQDQSGFSIFYPSAKVNAYQNITIDHKSRPVAEVLELLLTGTTLDYHQDGNTIIITERKTAIPTATDKVLKRLTGMVIDEGGLPLAGVTVRLKNDRTVSTATDENGHFHIDIKDESDILIFSFVGYQTQEMPVKGLTSLKIVLKEDFNRLNEVVVIGYGTSTRKDLTGSVGTIDAKTIDGQPVGNVLNALQGRIAGVQVTQANGLPGAAVTVQIRGQTSLNSGSLPLYIVDGVPFNSGNGNAVPATDNLNAYGLIAANGGISPFNSLNPADIESIDVLKDADATAIYGARGGNGVILITTKKGAKGKVKLDLNVNSGIGKVGNFIDMLSGSQYLQLRKEAFTNDAVTPTTINAPDLTTWSQNSFTDWQKTLVGGTAHTTDVQTKLSGGDENTTFSFTPGFHHETTVYPGSFAQNRLSSRLNVEHNSPDKKFYAMFSANYTYDNTNLPTSDLSSYYNLAPNYPAFTSTGALNWVSGITNPYAALMQPYAGITTHFGSSMVLRYTIYKGLDLRITGGYNTIDLNQNRQQPASTLSNLSSVPTSSASFADNYSRSYIVEPQLEYKTRISKGKLDVLLGTTYQENHDKGYSITGTNYSNDALLGNISSAGTLSASTTDDFYKYTSVFGRVNYNWDGKYIINGTIRNDGSSRFGDGKKFGTFGAVGAAWVFTEESFVKNNLSFLSFGKLRGSYGLTGNDQIQNYQFLSLYTTGSTSLAYQGTPIQYPSTLANSQIAWETNKKLEGAIDLGFLKDRILFTAAYYRNRTGNQLVYISTPAQVGFSSYLGNIPATIQNTGLELELNTINIKNKDFTWSTTLNFTMPQTKLVEFQDLATNASYKNSYTIGYPVPLTKLYVFNGINPANGVITYQTANTSGLPTYGTDQISAGAGHPFYGGINNDFTYKNFELGFFFQFNHKMAYTNSVTGTLGSMTNQNITTLNRWEQAGDVTPFGAATTTSGKTAYNAYSFYYNSSTAFYNSAYWLKLKNVNLSYRLPKQWLNHVGLSNVRIYAQGQNIFATSNYKNAYDPETGTSMPALRTIVIGLNASF